VTSTHYHGCGFLFSFHYFGERDTIVFPAGDVLTIGDSGAFSALTLGSPIELTDYATWVRHTAGVLDWHFTLDVIGDPEASWRRRATIDLLDALGIAWRASPHMIGTPDRVARFWTEFVDYDPGTIDTTFPVDHVDQLVAVTGIDVWSLCAHHLLPFSASVSIGYLADEHVLGLSKFARVAHDAAHRPTTQEQLVADIADTVVEVTGSEDVAVEASGLHLCMAMRGIRTPATMTTSVTRGRFRSQPDTRAEWLSLLER
jgi:GTP cyclohydrolase I